MKKLLFITTKILGTLSLLRHGFEPLISILRSKSPSFYLTGVRRFYVAEEIYCLIPPSSVLRVGRFMSTRFPGSTSADLSIVIPYFAGVSM